MKHKGLLAIKSLMIFFTLLISIAVVASFFAPVGWLPDLLTHFRLQYSVALLVLLLSWVIVKKPVIASILACLLLLNSLLLTPFFLPNNWRAAAADTPTSSSNPLTLFFANINYGNTDFDKIAHRVKEHNPDVVALVEVSSDHFAQIAQRLPEYPYTYQVNRGQRLGTAVLSKQPFAAQPEVFYDSSQTYPTVHVDVPTGDSLSPLAVFVVHPPPPITPDAATARNEVLDAVASHVQAQLPPVVVVGDFNSTSWSPQFQALLEGAHLQDSRVGLGLQASWPYPLPKLLRIPIDHVLLSPDISITQRQTLEEIGSDHLPVLVELNV